jgi:indoleacetamide hydrolase
MFERALGMTFTRAQMDDARGELRRKIERAYRELLQSRGLAAIVYPTQPMAAPLISPEGDLPSDEIEINGKPVNKGLIFIRNTHVTCALGVPGLALPAGLTSQGLPVGLELDGLAGCDSELLALGMAVEQAWPALPAPRAIG